MKLLLVGYGKMGRTIEMIAQQRGHEISGRIDVDNQHELGGASGDVAIEFSHPQAAFNNIKTCLERKVPIVCGTTGWLEKKQEIEKLTEITGGTFFYASNFSLGVNIFFKLNEQLARMMSSFREYDVAVDEIHHTEKKDAPSGTAITLAEGILKHVSQKKHWVNNDSDNPSALAVKSFRIDQVPGTHVVKYSSLIDDLEIKHIAHTREGFAMGAVMVAEWIRGKKGNLNMDDFLKF